ncbi:hypothetical protein D3C76_642440 [compost metagenome]
MVVDAVAGGRGLVQQRHDQHGRFEIAGHQATDDTGTVDVLAQLFDILGRALVGIGHHRATLEAFLGDFGPAHRRAPQRLHPGAVDAFGKKQLVVDLLEQAQVLGVEDIALGVFNHHPHRTAQAAQRLAVFQEVLDVRLALRNHLLEAGAQLQTGCHHVAQHQGDEGHQQHEQRAMVEYPALQPVAGASVEVMQVADHRHGVLLDIAHVRVLALIDSVLILVEAHVRHGCRPAPASDRVPRWRQLPVIGSSAPSTSGCPDRPG